MVCPLSPSVCLPCSLLVFFCAPPLRYLTWLPPSSLLTCSSLVISVCVFSLCVSFTPCPVIAFVGPCSCSCSCSLFDMFWSFLHFFHVLFELWLWFELCILLCYFVSYLVATLPFVPVCLLLVFVISFKIKLTFCFSPDLASSLTAFGSTSSFWVFPFNQYLTYTCTLTQHKQTSTSRGGWVLPDYT